MTYQPTGKGYFSGGGLMEIGLMQAQLETADNLSF